MSLAILYVLDQALRLAEIFTDEFYDINIFHLIVSTNVVDFSDGSVAQDQVNRLTVILDIQPVAHIESLSVYRKRLICQRICNHKRNEFFRELVWAVVVGTAADRHRQAVRSVICHNKQIRRCLGSAVRTGCIRRLGGDMEVVARACPLFVPLVENGRYRPGDTVVETVAREYLLPVKESGIDTLILGCTHYPLLHDVVAEVMGPEVTLIDTGEEAAWELKRTLQARQLLSDSESGETTLFASDQPDDFGVMAGHFLQEKLTRPVLPVNIDRY